jgi:hypothetical protein
VHPPVSANYCHYRCASQDRPQSASLGNAGKRGDAPDIRPGFEDGVRTWGIPAQNRSGWPWLFLLTTLESSIDANYPLGTVFVNDKRKLYPFTHPNSEYRKYRQDLAILLRHVFMSEIAFNVILLKKIEKKAFPDNPTEILQCQP